MRGSTDPLIHNHREADGLLLVQLQQFTTVTMEMCCPNFQVQKESNRNTIRKIPLGNKMCILLLLISIL